MSEFNEVLEGSLNQILIRRLAMQGQSAAPAVAPELFPVLTLENDRPEWGLLKGEQLCGSAAVRAGAVGEYAWSALNLHTDFDSMVAVVTQAKATLLGTTGIGLFVYSASPAGTLAGPFGALRDLRTQVGATFGARKPAATHYNGTTSSAVNASARQVDIGYGAVGAVVQCDVPIILGKGMFLFFFADTANIGHSASFQWYERALQAGER